MTDDERFEAEGELVERHPIGSKGGAVMTAREWLASVFECTDQDHDFDDRLAALEQRDLEIRIVVRDEMISEIRESMADHNRLIRVEALREAEMVVGRWGDDTLANHLHDMADRAERGE